MRFYAVSAFVFPLVLRESPAIRQRASYRRPLLPMRLMAQRPAAARRKMRFSAARYLYSNVYPCQEYTAFPFRN